MQLTLSNNFRGRLIAGGTYFKSKINGYVANDISIQLDGDATVVNLTVFGGRDPALNVSSSPNGKLSKMVFGSGVTEGFTFTCFAAGSFSVVGTVSGALGTALEGKIFRTTQVTFSILSKGHSIGDTFTVPALIKETFTGADFITLRAAVAASKIILMPERGIDDADIGGTDDTVVAPFPRTYLSFGSGLLVPPVSDLIIPQTLINYEESDTVNVVVAKLYRWYGDDVDGSWVEQPFTPTFRS